MQFHIEDMTCGGCAGKVVKAIQSIDPNAQVVTDPPTRSVQVTSSATRVQIDAALRQAGYPPRESEAVAAKNVIPALAQEMPPGISMQVEGMDCASCVGKIETALARMPGVSDVRLNFATEKLELTLAPDSATQAGDIEKTIKSLGFGVSASTSQKTASDISMQIEGMDCASCISKIETALARMPGVSDIRLNFATEKLELTLAPDSATQVGDIEKTIKSLGFGVSASTSQKTASGIEAVAPHPRWWQTRKGKQVVGLGVLMGAAYAMALFFPDYGSWVFSAAVIVGVFPFARKALALARSGSPFSIETLMSVAALGALFIGEAEEAAAVVFLFSVGELLESVAAGSARAGIRALASLVPKTAVLLDPAGGQREVPAASLRVNDHVLVRPGDRVSADGVIIEGTSSLDESPVTGESIPRAKAAGDSVFAGSINVDGVLQVRVDKAAADNTISRIIQLVEQAQASKAPTARFIEQFSRYYTPAVMAIAALIIIVPPLAVGADWGTWL